MATSMTQGSPARHVLVFTGPLLIGTVLQQLYSFVDAIIVGRTLGTEALAAVGCTAGLSFFVTGFVWGMGGGLAVPASQRFGARDLPGIRRALVAGTVVCLSVALVLTAISVPLARGALQVMNTPPEILDGATQFIGVIFAGLVVPAATGFSSSVFRALGDSRTPTILWVLSSLLNIALVYLFILVFGWGIAGAAWATVLAQLVGLVIGVAYLRRRLAQYIPGRAEAAALRPSHPDFPLMRADLVEHSRLGLAMGFQASIISIGEIAIQRALNGLGATAVAASTAGVRIGQLAVSPLGCFGMAMAVFAGQNYGARAWGRIRAGVRQTLAMSMGFAVAIGLVNALAGGVMASWFITDSPEAVRLAHTYLAISAIGYPALAALYVLRSTLQGMGRTAVPTLAGIMELVARVAVAAFLVGPFGFVGVSLAGPAAWVGSCLPLIVAWEIERRRLRARERTDAAAGGTSDGAPAPDRGTVGSVVAPDDTPGALPVGPRGGDEPFPASHGVGEDLLTSHGVGEDLPDRIDQDLPAPDGLPRS